MKKILLIGLVTGLSTAWAGAQGKVDFGKQIVPILEQNCLKCHGPEKQKGKLRLDTKEAFLKGGANGAIVTAGDPAKSDLFRRITLPKSDDDFMPPESDPLPKAQIDLIKQWITEGANWPDGITVAKAGGGGSAGPKLPDVKPTANELKVIEQFGKQGVDIRPISQKDSLREANFRLIGDKCTDALIAPLKEVKTLTQLNLANTKITDAGLASISGLGNLTALNLSNTGITDAGLAQIKGLSNLTYLNLYGTKVSDKGLESLKGLGNLQKLYVWQSQVTSNGVANLKKSLPKVYVDTGWVLPPEEPKAAAKADAKADDKAAEKKDEPKAKKKKQN